jgi:hypothetical protein
MKESPTVEINPAKRILKMPGAVCGGISTGSDKIRSGYGNGDCLYFDFEHLVFAVADGSERFPWASRDLLNRLAESLSRTGAPETVRDWKDLMNKEIYSGQRYQHKTTFSSVAIKREGEDVLLIIAHGGDSAVTVMNSATGSICRQTGRDMNFAGRSKGIVDVTQYRIADHDSRVLLSTDGFDDLWRFCRRRSLLGSGQDVFARYPVDSIGEMIDQILRENMDSFEYDDIGFIIIDPYRTERIDGMAVIMGGTRPYEEQQYLAKYKSGSHNRWVLDGQWRDHDDLFAGAGIRVLIQKR